MYILCRRDLSEGQRAVQSCHAVAEFMTQHGHLPEVQDWAKNHRTMVILGVDSEEDLAKWESTFGTRQVEFSTFKEEDIGFQRTAMAVTPKVKNRFFRGLRLL